LGLAVPERYSDRAHAGRCLADLAEGWARRRALVLAIPNGGIPVAEPVARRWELELDVLIVRKIGAPFQPEYGLGAITEFGDVEIDRARSREAGYDRAALEPSVRAARAEVEERRRVYRGDAAPPSVAGRAVLLVDDGVATGGTMATAVRSVRSAGANRVGVAVGVAPRVAVRALARVADEVICPLQPEEFGAVGEFYEDFQPLKESDMARRLRRSAELRRSGPGPVPPAPR
jgi:putative phosphoribosyl transferase